MRLNWFIRYRPGASGPLRRLAPSWAASPVRRIVQTLCFATFLLLLLYVLQPAAAVGLDAPLPDLAAAQAHREFLPAQLFLMLDPLASLAAALAARTFIWALVTAGVMVALGLVIPRVFCGYFCPLGTLIDLTDWAIMARIRRLHVRGRGWYRHLKYYLLAAIVLCAALGVSAAGWLSAIPIVTRGLATGSPLLLGVLLLSLMGKRFWCRYVCPSGAVFSLASRLRLTSRNVTPNCVRCGKCVDACDFDAIEADFATRHADCTFCQSCGGVCPADAIEFGPRTGGTKAALSAEPVESSPAAISRRGFIAAGLGGLALACAWPRAILAQPPKVVRPPGSRRENEFLDLCLRCGLCVKACPTGLLQPAPLMHGLEQIGVPYADANAGRCDPTCNLCGQVCPTGAIQRLTVQQKRQWKMGLAAVDTTTCLAFKGQDCSFCAQACAQAGYDAMDLQPPDAAATAPEATSTPTSSEPAAVPVPRVLPDKCVGCGACQNACHRYVVRAGGLKRPAVRVSAN